MFKVAEKKFVHTGCVVFAKVAGRFGFGGGK